jgi:hypothetical protein
MSTYPTPATRAKRAANPTPSLASSPSGETPLNGLHDPGPPPLGDAAGQLRWLRALRESVLDLAAAAEDQTRPPGQRDLGRRLARKQIQEAEAAIGGLLDEATRAAAGATTDA